MRAQRNWARVLILGASLLTAATLALPLASTGAAPRLAQETVSVQIAPVAGSGVSGAATLPGVAATTTVSFEVSGVPPGAGVRSTLHSGACATPSASFA